MYQFEKPAKDAKIAVMETEKGTIKLRFFPEFAPKAVENFLTHAENGYYNGITFHRVINDFMIQGGDPTGTGAGGESIWGHSFEDEFDVKLRNYRGALSMANAGPCTNGSQFFIVQAKEVPVDLLHQMKQVGVNARGDGFPDEVVEKYAEIGGTPWLDYKHTVFGQVFEGMDVVDAIAAAEADSHKVVINKITVEPAENHFEY
ncbi:MAG: peptidylprolyl isomerase [Negativibacillus sp.]